MTTNRTRREDPARTEPYRQWEHLIRSQKGPGAARHGADSPTGGESDSAGPGAAADDSSLNGAKSGGMDQTISDAVKLGYKIIEEQIDQGKRAAAELSHRAYASNALGADTADFVKRLMRFYTDIGATCFDFMETLSRNVVTPAPRAGDTVHEAPRDSHAYDDAGTRATASHNVPVEIASDAQTRVNLSLSGPIGNSSLGVQALFALDASLPPLHDIEFRTEPTQHTPTLVVRIPRGQPEGRYTGVVIDFETNEPRGTLTISIGHKLR